MPVGRPITTAVIGLLLLPFLFSLNAVGTPAPQDPLTGTLAAAEARFSGQVDVQTNGSAVFLSAPPDGELVLTGRGTTSFMTVNWTRDHAIGAGQSPSNPNGSMYSHTTDTTTGERNHADASVEFTVAAGFSNILIATDAPTRLRGNQTALNPARGGQWIVGAPDNVTSPDGSSGFGVEHQIPETGLLGAGLSSVDLSGDVPSTIYLWGGWLNVTADGATTTYRSGTWYENATATGLGPRGATRDEYNQLLRLEVGQANISIVVSAGQVDWHAATAFIQLNGNLGLESADAFLQNATHTYSVQGKSFSIDGTTNGTWSHGDGESHLVAQFSGRTPVVNYPPTNITSQPNADAVVDASPVTSTNRHASPWWWLLPGAFAFGGVILFAVARRRGSREHALDRAEVELLENRPRRARAWAKRSMRRAVSNADAVFLIGASLMQEGRYDEAARVLTRLLAGVADASKPSIAFLIGLSMARDGRGAESMAFLRVAATDPLLLQRIQADETLQPLRGLSEFRALVRDDRPTPYG